MQTEKSGRPQAMIAMSGGVDSSVAAYLMQQAGYDCMGVTVKLKKNEKRPACRAATPAARSPMWRMPAAWPMRWACRTMSLIRRLAFHDEFMALSATAYQHGATPNPCLDCNRYLKFGLLETRARALGCDVLATGHYARIEQLPDGRYTLRKAVDATKGSELRARLAHAGAARAHALSARRPARARGA
ncbi:MAG: hypothetical protein V8T10_09590 [Merdibacter sp.]